MIESINLNLIPSGVSPVCHVSQYDAGRQIKINLFEGINPYTIQSGDAFTLNVRKPDNTIVTTSVSGTQGNNYIIIATTEQIAAVVGENLCELKITNGSTVIGTLNFIMQVERDVLADGIPSQSVIEDLDERIAEAIGDNYYNKTETDDLLALKADKTEFYNFYPTEQESGAIASFTDGAENIPLKSLVSQIVAVESGNGQPKSPTNPYTISGFDNGKIEIDGKNIAEGDYTTPTTARGITITPIEKGLKVTGTTTNRALINLFKVGKHIPLKEGDKVTISLWYSGDISFAESPLIGYYANGSYAGNIGLLTPQNEYKVTWTVTSTYANDINSYLRAYIYIPTNNTCNFEIGLQIEIGDTATTYEAYNGNTYTFNFGQTVYDGHFDNKGNLIVTHKFDLNKGDVSEGWFDASTGGIIRFAKIKSDMKSSPSRLELLSNIANFSLGNENNIIFGVTIGGSNLIYYYPDSTVTDLSSLYTFLSNNNLQVVYPLANPITLEITSQDIPTLLGDNNIFSNTGDVDVTIRADIGLYIDKRLNVSRSTPNNLIRAAAYVDDPESVNETQEDNVEPQNEER